MFPYLLILDTEEEQSLFEELYKRYRDEMYHIACRILKNTHDAEDVVHESFLALSANMDKVAGNTPKKTWNYIATIVRNRSYNLYHMRRRHADEPLTDILLDSREAPDKSMEEKMIDCEQQTFLREYIQSLPDTYRDIIIMKYYQEMSGAEIADALGMTADNVRHILMRARKKMRNMMEGRGYPGED